MNCLKLSICGGLLSALAWSVTPSDALAQCACGQSSGMEGMVYQSAESAIPADEALLAEVDNPAEIINLTVVVHEKAIVKINGEPTTTKGTTRPYIVRGLKAGKTYEFLIEGLVTTESGAEYGAKEPVKLKAGESKQVVLHVRRQNRKPVPPVAAVPPAAAPAAK